MQYKIDLGIFLFFLFVVLPSEAQRFQHYIVHLNQSIDLNEVGK